MLNNNHKITDCAFAESLVAYLYDEAGAAEKIALETHLENCASCADELAEIGFARTAVHEWRVAEFDVLPTPVFEIPMQTVQSPAITEDSPSWFAGWRQIFSFKPALAMSSLVILVAFFGIAAFIFNFKSDEQVAEKLDNKNLTKSVASPTVEKNVEPKKEIVSDKNSADAETTALTSAPKNIADKKAVSAKTAAVKISTETPSKISPVKVVQKDVKRMPKTNTAAKSDVPRLTEADDEEDDSIRLADLFDEIGTE